MNSFKEQLYQATVYRKSRDKFRNWVLREPHLMEELTEVAFDVGHEFHFKACWIIELISEVKIELMIPYIERFCDMVSLYTHDSSVRTIARTTFFIIKENYSKNPKCSLSQKQILRLTEACLDRLIRDEKVAAKAYSAEALYILGKYQDWIHPELRQILSGGYTSHSPAYQATARKIIKLIDKKERVL